MLRGILLTVDQLVFLHLQQSPQRTAENTEAGNQANKTEPAGLATLQLEAAALGKDNTDEGCETRAAATRGGPEFSVLDGFSQAWTQLPNPTVT